MSSKGQQYECKDLQYECSDLNIKSHQHTQMGNYNNGKTTVVALCLRVQGLWGGGIVL